MKISTKTVLALYGLFALMGVWFGNTGFDSYQGDGHFTVVVAFFILTMIGAIVQIIVIAILSEDDKNPTKLYENAGVRIQIGFSLMSMSMAYGYNAGPLYEDGAVISAWLLFPMLASLPVIHMMLKEPAREPQGMGVVIG